MNRRLFLKAAWASAVALPIIGTGACFAEAVNLTVEHRTIHLKRLPESFAGLRVAFLTDIHHGPYVSLDFLRTIVRTVRSLNPDLIIHGGDYTLRSAKYIAPCFDVLKALTAPLGVYGVLGNHDSFYDLPQMKREMKRAGISELTNRGEWIRRGSDRLWLCGVDDFLRGRPIVSEALGNTTRDDACLLVSHNPDVAETMLDPRVSFMLSGHTHGGQVHLPGMKHPFMPSLYGDKYSHGLVEAPKTSVYVSRGLGMTGLPIRFNCPPELTMLTLQPEA